MTERMNGTNANKRIPATTESLAFIVAVAFATVLCIVCCTLILIIPTQSLSVDTVYQGF